MHALTRWALCGCTGRLGGVEGRRMLLSRRSLGLAIHGPFGVPPWSLSVRGLLRVRSMRVRSCMSPPVSPEGPRSQFVGWSRGVGLVARGNGCSPHAWQMVPIRGGLVCLVATILALQRQIWLHGPLRLGSSRREAPAARCRRVGWVHCGVLTTGERAAPSVVCMSLALLLGVRLLG